MPPKWAAAGGGNRLPARHFSLMVKRFAAVGVVSVCLFAVCGAFGESKRPVRNLPQPPAIAGIQFLPDAPSAMVASSNPSLPAAGEPRWSAGSVFPADPDSEWLGASIHEKDLPQAGPGKFFSKYLSASNQPLSRYQPSSSDKLMGRATDAASRIFVTRDETGRSRLNTQYFLRVLTSVAADSASRRYRAHYSGTAPLSDFGSTVGNDAGMNLLHEFGPGIRNKVTGHMPEFVAHVGARLAGVQNSR